MPATFPANPLENDVIQLNQNKYIYRGGVWRILREPENEVVRNIFYTSDSRKLHSIDKETSLLLSFEKPTISDSSIYNRSISNTTNLPSISRHGAHVSGSEEIFAEPINYFLNDDFTISFDMFSQNDRDFDIMSFSTGSDNLGSITYTDTNGFSIGSSILSGSDSFINNSWNTFVITHTSSGDFNLYRGGEFVASASHGTFPITVSREIGTTSEEGSPIDADTKLLLNANYIYDESFSKKDITLGNTEIVRKGYKFGGSNDSISIAGSTDFNFGTDDFTIEFWLNPNNTTDWQALVASPNYYISGYNGNWVIDKNSGNLRMYSYDGNSNSSEVSLIVTMSSSEWQHIAFVRNSGTLTCYINGVAAGSTTNFSSRSLSDGQNGIKLGTATSGPNNLNGYMSDIRISKGTARYTADFDEVVTTKDSNHKLILTGEATDQSDPPQSLTFNGNVHPTAKYGQGSFEFTSGDAINVPGTPDFNFGTEDFTIEGWIRTSTYNSDSYARRIFLLDGPTGNSSAENFQLAFHNTGKIWLWAYNGSSATIDQVGSITVADGNWHHFAVTRESGTIKLWIDGVFDTSVTYASSLGNLNSGSPRPQFGRYDSSNGRFIGNLSDIRISKGVARYTTAFNNDLPTAPLETEDSRTKLLLNTNSALQDFEIGRMASAPTYAGDTKVVRRGYYFDGSNDYIETESSSDFAFDGDFTIEMWVYRTADPSMTLGEMLTTNPTSQSNSQIAFYYNKNTNSFGFWSYNSGTSSNVSSNTDVPLNAWQHLAVVRNGNTIKLYQDGVETGSTTNTFNLTPSPATVMVGSYKNLSGTRTEFFPGYLSDIRITKGEAVYTSAFTPPESLSVGTNTKLLLSGAETDDYDSDRSLTFSGAYPTAKFGDGAYYFDGSSHISTSVPFSPGTDDFTIEAWVNLDSVTTSQNVVETIACSENWYQTGYNGGWLFMADFRGNTNTIVFYGTNGNPASGGSASAVTATNCGLEANKWHHVAVCRESGTLTIYVDGVAKKSESSYTFSVTQDLTHVGRKQPNHHYGQSDYFNGYLDDIRISKGVARYTEISPGPPTSELGGGTSTTTLYAFQDVPINNFRVAFSPTQNDYFIRNIKFHDKILTEQQIKDYDPYQNNTGATHYYPLRITTNNNTYLKDLAGSVDMQASSGVIEGKSIAGTGGAYFNGSNSTRIDISPIALGSERIQVDGRLDYYQLDYDSLTVEAWIYLDVDITGDSVPKYYPVFGNTGYRDGGSRWYGHHSLFGVAEYNSKLVLVTLGNHERDGRYYYATSLELQPRQWHHVAVCVGPQGRMLFLDGTREQDTITNYWPKTGYNDDFYVGKGQFFHDPSLSVAWAYFKGWMDDVRISNSAKYNSNFTPPARHKIFQGNTQSRTKALPYVPLKVIKDNDYYDIESNNRNWFLRRGYSQNEVFNSPQITNNGEEFYRRSSVFPNSYTSGLVASRPSGSTETKLLFIDSEGVMQDLTPVNEVEIGDIAELEPLQSTGSLPEGKYILFASGSDIYYRDKNNTTYKINTET